MFVGCPMQLASNVDGIDKRPLFCGMLCIDYPVRQACEYSNKYQNCLFQPSFLYIDSLFNECIFIFFLFHHLSVCLLCSFVG